MRVLKMSFDDRSECLAIEYSPENTRIVNIGKLGTALTAILNADYRQISHAIRNYNLADGTIDTFDVISDILTNGEPPNADFLPPNYNLIYQQLISNNPIISIFYNAEDWAELIYDFYDGPIGGGYGSFTDADISAVKELLDASEMTPELRTYNFLEYLNECDLIPPFSIAPPAVYREPVKNDLRKPISTQTTESFLSEIYAQYVADGKASRKTSYSYNFNQHGCLGFALVASLLELSRNGKTVRKCKNCGRYFIPENRSDTMYCDNPSPADPGRTCKEYGSQRLWYERQKDDELATLSRNILSAKHMLAKRNPDIEDYKMSYDYFRNERKRWKDAVEAGKKSRSEYREWLLYMQGQKVIKEATHGNR